MIPAKATRAIPTGLIISSPGIVGTVHDYMAVHYNALVCSRSGMAREKSIFVTNSPGVIDPDYRGEVLVLLYNGGHEAQYIEHNDRIAQIILIPIPVPRIEESSFNLGDEATTRGASGFGSTGR